VTIKVINIYRNNKNAVFIALIVAMYLYYIFRVSCGAGGDLDLRISESKYFLAGVNPYDVYVGHVSKINDFGNPNAYSFFSYYFVSPLTLINNVFWQKIIYSSVDMIALVGGIYLTNRLLGISNFSGAIVVAVLLGSVFFWQQVTTLNYNLIVSFGLLLVFYGIHRGFLALTVLGMIIVGLKPSMAIPVFIYLVFTSRWIPLFMSMTIYFLTLFITSFLIKTSPIDLILQLKDTQFRFSNGYTDGFFFFLKPLLGNSITVFGVLTTIAVIYSFRRQLDDCQNGIEIVVALGLGLFYNHVHAWIIAYPLFLIAIENYRLERSTILPVICIFLFLIVPRLSGLFELQYRDLYIAFHNVLRYSLIFIATFSLIKSRLTVLKTNYLPI